MVDVPLCLEAVEQTVMIFLYIHVLVILDFNQMVLLIILLHATVRNCFKFSQVSSLFFVDV